MGLGLAAVVIAGGWAVPLLRRRQKDLLPSLPPSKDTGARRRLAPFLAVAGCEEYSERALAQVEARARWEKNFLEVLGSQFSPSELTYSRYRAPAETVFAGIDQQFIHIAEHLGSLRALMAQPLSPLLLSQKQGKLTQIDSLLSQNDQALAQIDHIIASLQAIVNQDSVSLQRALTDLQALAARAQDYVIPQ